MTDAAPGAAANDAAQAQAGQGDTKDDANTTQTQEKPWYDGHITEAEDIGYIQNKGWKAPGELLGAYKNLEKFRGVPADQLLKLPEDFADEKAMGEVYQRLGRPDTPDNYEIKLPDALKDVKMDDARLTWARGVAHKMGLNNAQFNALIAETAGYENGIITEADTKLRQIVAEQTEALKKEWGDAYPEREHFARKSMKTFLPGTLEEKAEFVSTIEQALGTAVTLKLFANIGEKLGEDKIHSADTGDRPFGYTPEQAKADIKALSTELQGDKARLNVYNEGKGPDYEKMQRLQKLAYGGSSAA